MPHLSVNGIEYHFEVEGAGPPLILIAGLASDAASWAPVRPGLAQRFQLVLPDNRGAGQTRPIGAPFTPDAIADDLCALMDHLQIDAADVLGHSMGGLLALHLAATRPERVRRLVVAAASPAPSPRNAQLMADLALVRRHDEDLFYRLFFQWLFAPAFFSDPAAVAEAVRLSKAYPFAQPAEGFAAQTAAMAHFSPDVLSAVRAPTLALCGALDLLFPPAVIAESLAAIPGLQVEVLAGAAHSLHWDQPAGFVESVAAFCAAPL